MAEGVVEMIAADPNSFRERNLSGCDLIVHAQDFVSYIAKQNRPDSRTDCHLFVYSQIKDAIKRISACQIRPLFVVDGTLEDRENTSQTLSQSRTICEFLATSGVRYAVSRSNAIPTCVALSSMLGIPILGCNYKFYLYSFPSPAWRNIFSRPLSEPIFIPMECLQNLDEKSSQLRANVYDASGCLRIERIPINHRPLLSLIMELVSLPQTANKNLELCFVTKWLSAAGPLAILQQIMQTAVNYDDPCLILQSVIDYLISFTPDFEEAISLLPYLGVDGDNFRSPDIYDIEPGSPQLFLNLAMDIIDGRPSRHSRIGISSSTLLDLFHRGKIDASILSTSNPNLNTPIDVLRRLQRSALSNSISASNSWSYLADFFHFSTVLPLNEKFSALMLCCLLWHSSSTHHCPGVEFCPIILSSVFCALTSMLCERATVVFSAALEYFESKKVNQSNLEETYIHQAREILQIYSELLSFCSIVDGSGTSKMSLFKNVLFDPIFVVFPCLRLSVLIAIKLHSCDPEKRPLELTSSLILDDLKADISGLLSVFHQFMHIIKTVKIYWNDTQISPSKAVVKIPPSLTKAPNPVAPVKPLRINASQSSNSLGELRDPRSDTPVSISLSESCEKRTLSRQQFPGSTSDSPSSCASQARRKFSVTSNGGNRVVGQPNFDRPKTPPPANAFMKKSKGGSAYAARLAQRYGNNL
ncbi:hypothetical protein Aperf_G00000003863 [Anoplocephala perfoliata]